jgi:hypothetical protein
MTIASTSRTSTDSPWIRWPIGREVGRGVPARRAGDGPRASPQRRTPRPPFPLHLDGRVEQAGGPIHSGRRERGRRARYHGQCRPPSEPPPPCRPSSPGPCPQGQLRSGGSRPGRCTSERLPPAQRYRRQRAGRITVPPPTETTTGPRRDQSGSCSLPSRMPCEVLPHSPVLGLKVRSNVSIQLWRCLWAIDGLERMPW